MGELISRKSLYDLVWSEPSREACKRFGISGVALARACPEGLYKRQRRVHAFVHSLSRARFIVGCTRWQLRSNYGMHLLRQPPHTDALPDECPSLPLTLTAKGEQRSSGGLAL